MLLTTGVNRLWDPVVLNHTQPASTFAELLTVFLLSLSALLLTFAQYSFWAAQSHSTKAPTRTKSATVETEPRIKLASLGLILPNIRSPF